MRSSSWQIATLVVILGVAAVSCAGQTTPVPGQGTPSPSTIASSPTPTIAPSPSEATTDVSGTIMSGGLERTYLLHLPPASTRLQPTPIVIALHGWPMTVQRMSDITHLSTVADVHGFAVLYPQGYGESWSVPGGLPTPAQQKGVDDVAFLRALLDSVGPTYQVDATRAIAAGISNGGHLAQTLGCALADHLVGIVPVAAPLPTGPIASCKPSRAVSVLELVGTFDQKAATFPDTLPFWAATDGCPGSPVTSDLPDVAHDQTTVTIATFTGCHDGTEVTGYLVNGGGHAWPGGKPLGSVDDVGITTRQFDASELIWTFLSRHGGG